MFVTLGLITSVPVSAGIFFSKTWLYLNFSSTFYVIALDVVLYGAQFYGMKLSGIILIAVGFFLVMFPDNWPDYITRLLR